MSQFEFKAVPAPVKGTRAKGVKTSSGRFALAMTNLLNDMAADGWEYLRADSLPCEERQGLTGKTTAYQNILIFRRALPSTDDILSAAPPHVGTPDRSPEAVASAAAAASLTALAPEGDAPAVSAASEADEDAQTGDSKDS